MAHKLVAAIVIASLVTSGGVLAFASNSGHILNIVREVSFTINPSYVNVTSLASLNLGTLSAGQTGTQTSSAQVNVTTTGTYTIAVMNTDLLHDAFSVFNVTIIGLGTTPITLSFNHVSQSVSVTISGLDSLTISVLYTVNTGASIQRGMTRTNTPFLEFVSNILVPTPVTTTTHSATTSTHS